MERHFLLRDQRLKLIAGNLGSVFGAIAGARLPSVAEMCADANPNDTEDHLVICPVCGQMLDCRDGAQLAYHNGDYHRPKLFRPNAS
jgi:hypothetical protein